VPAFAERGEKDQEAALTGTSLHRDAETDRRSALSPDRVDRRPAGRKERLTVLGFKPVANTPDQFGDRIKLEMDKWGKVVRDAKLRIE
jgi:hypothetical protein